MIIYISRKSGHFQTILLSIFLGFGLFPHHVSPYSGGAPRTGNICETMIPGHGERPQTTDSPYSVKVSNLNPRGGEKVQITLYAPEGKSFRGFLVMVKKAGDNKSNFGRFDPTFAPDVGQALSCFDNSGSAMTHVNNKDKNEVTVEWVVPNVNMNDLHVITTFVKTMADYWTHISHPKKLTITKKELLTIAASVRSAGTSTSNTLRGLLKKSYSSCGVNKGCIGLPNGCIEDFLSTQNKAVPKICKVLLSFATEGDRNVYKLTGRPFDGDSTTGYIAVALSNDAKMGKDSVVGCYINSGNVVIERFYNSGYTNTKASSPTLGLVSRNAGLNEGYLFCEFEQTDHEVDGLNVKLRQKKYHYLLARGTSASANGLQAHGEVEVEASASGEAIHVTDTRIIINTNSSRTLHQLHGSFMIVAWLVCASTGMFIARYYKLTHTDFMPFNKTFWFLLHLTCMFSTAFLTACAAILIIIKKEGYSFKSAGIVNWHPILGTVLFVMTIFEVIVAFLRPHPGTPRRTIFNWVHWCVGNSAHIISFACIFLANDLKVANLGSNTYTFTMMGAILFHLVMHLVMSFHTLWADSQMDAESMRAIVPGPMRSNGLFSEAPGTGFRTVMLVMYSLGLLGFTVALLVHLVARPLKTKKA